MEQNQDVLKRFLSQSATDSADTWLENFRVLEKVSVEHFNDCRCTPKDGSVKRGIILDVETTGRTSKDESVIQLALIEFFFHDDGIKSLGEFDSALHDPGVPIEQSATNVHGLIGGDIKGKSIDPADIKDFIDRQKVDVVIAHNASFDRPLVEREFWGAGLNTLPWACSMRDVDWNARGKPEKLELLAHSMGYWYGAHDALDDVIATAYILTDKSADGRQAINELIRNSLKPKAIIRLDLQPHSVGQDHVKAMLNSYGFRYQRRGVEHWRFREYDEGDKEIDRHLQVLKEAGVVKGAWVYSQRPEDRFTDRLGASTYQRLSSR